ncbi:hypothetical protein D3C71_1601670 [compost metagenome]
MGKGEGYFLSAYDQALNGVRYFIFSPPGRREVPDMIKDAGSERIDADDSQIASRNKRLLLQGDDTVILDFRHAELFRIVDAGQQNASV